MSDRFWWRVFGVEVAVLAAVLVVFGRAWGQYRREVAQPHRGTAPYVGPRILR